MDYARIRNLFQAASLLGDQSTFPELTTKQSSIELQNFEESHDAGDGLNEVRYVI